MGVTIAYSGRVPAATNPNALRTFLSDHAREQEWRHEAMEREFPSARLGPNSLEMARIRGALLLPHVGSEPLPILHLEESGILCDLVMRQAADDAPVELSPQVIVKTQFAGPEAHIEIVEFLEALRSEFVPGLHIEDETNFLEHRDREALDLAFQEGWDDLLRPLRETPPDERPSSFEIGGFEIRQLEDVPPDEPLALLSKEHRQVVEGLSMQLKMQYGGFGMDLGDDASGLEDLDLLMIEIDPLELSRRPDRSEADTMAHQLGASFGLAIVSQLGGFWSFDDEEGLALSDVGGVGLRVNPFQVAAERLVYGPSHSFHNYFTSFRMLTENLRRQA